MKLQKYLDLFVYDMTYVKIFSKETISAYIRDVEKLFEYMRNKGMRSLSALTYSDFVDLLKELRKRLQASSIRRAVFCWKTFFKFLHRERKITHKAWNVIGLIEPPKAWNKVPEMLSQEEMCKLLDSLEDITPFERMTKVILEMLYGTGMRVSELCNLRIKDINLKSRTVLIKEGKGLKDRMVIIGTRHVRLLKDYWATIQKSRTVEDYAIVNMRGKHLERINVFKLFKKAVTAHGISKNISPVTFRHCYATHMLENGAEIRVIQELLGHENIANTVRYLNLSLKIVKERFDRFSP